MPPPPEKPNDVERHGMPVPISALERETGISKEVARKWEIRYGFPCPERDENGDRLYSAKQVLSLRLIRRLLGAGMRPGKVVGLDLATLEQLAQNVTPDMVAKSSNFSTRLLETLARHDLRQLEYLLRGQLHRQGLSLFARETVARLNVIVGEAWLRGEIRVFEEHLYSEVVRGILQEAVRTVTETSGAPRVVLSTAPGELHTLGLLMANAVLSLEGACCIGLGAQTPSIEIVTAVKVCAVDVVGLSFSIAHPARESAQYLRDLRSRLDPAVDIWAGGLGVARLRRMEGVRFMSTLEEIGPAVQTWLKREIPSRART